MQEIFTLIITLIVGLIIISFIRLIYCLTLPDIKFSNDEVPVSQVNFKARNLLREQKDIKING